jgi:Arc/MetJ-type ribon-helix-helix transcriptional regulator
MNSNDKTRRTGERRPDDDVEKKLQALRDALIEGEQRGPAIPFDFDAFIQEMRRKRNVRSS